MKENFNAYLILLLVLLSTTSCESIVEGNGHVYSYEDKTPISGATIEQYSTQRNGMKEQGHTFTDENGYFEATTGLVGCGTDCPDLYVIIKKEGYQSQQMENPLGDTIFLKH